MELKEPKPVAIIAARGFSKGVPRKNLRWIAGRPLISYAVQCALEAGIFGGVYVTSDDEDILKLTGMLGAVPLRRPKHLATDRAPLDPVIENALNQMMDRGQNVLPAIAASIQPTSPLLRAETIRKAFAHFTDHRADTLLCVCDDRHLRWRKTAKTGKWTPLYAARVNRQQLPPTFRETGGLVFFRSEYLLKSHTRFGPRCIGFEISREEALDIDTLDDLVLADYFLRGTQRIVFICDGSDKEALDRCLLLAEKLGIGDPYFLVYHLAPTALSKLKHFHYPFRRLANLASPDCFTFTARLAPKLIISDVGHSSRSWIKRLQKTAPVFEAGVNPPVEHLQSLLAQQHCFARKAGR